jgi:hypothetical protein
MNATEIKATGSKSRPDEARRRRRLLAVMAAVTAATLGWGLIEGGAGVDLRAPAFDGSTVGQDIELGAVIFTSVVASLAAWGLLALLERNVSLPRRIWTIAALAGLALSLAGPMSGTGISSGDRGLLALLHLIVAAVLIPLLYRTADTQNTKE